MRNDLISREALKKAIKDNGYSHYFEIFDIIDNAPTVELTEEQAIDKLHETGWLIRHDKEMTAPTGEWEKCQNDLFRCSNCRQADEVPTVMGTPIYNFCPNCGADMRGENTDL